MKYMSHSLTENFTKQDNENFFVQVGAAYKSGRTIGAGFGYNRFMSN